LRYVNRLAVPQGTEPSRWLHLNTNAPPLLTSTYAFQWTQTWECIGENADVAATVTAARIEIEDHAVATGHQGILLDIDIFNLKVRNAPPLSEVCSWFERAHATENAIFEACVTDELRGTFA
jgi:uncharacterized protein (TIGR04255 family)